LRITTETPYVDRERRKGGPFNDSNEDREDRLRAHRRNLLVTRLAEGRGKPFKTLVQTVTRRSASRLDVLRLYVSHHWGKPGAVQGVVRGKRKFKRGQKVTYPGTLSQAVKAKLVCDLGSVHGVLKGLKSVSGKLGNIIAEKEKPRAHEAGCGEESGYAYRQILLVGEDKKNGVPELILVEHALELLASLDDTVTIVAVDDEDDTLGVLEVMPPQRSDLVLTTDIPHGELDVLVLDSLDVEACMRGSKAVSDTACFWLASWLGSAENGEEKAMLGSRKRLTYQWWGWSSRFHRA